MGRTKIRSTPRLFDRHTQLCNIQNPKKSLIQINSFKLETTKEGHLVIYYRQLDEALIQTFGQANITTRLELPVDTQMLLTSLAVNSGEGNIDLKSLIRSSKGYNWILKTVLAYKLNYKIHITTEQI